MKFLFVLIAITVNFEVYAWFNISTNGISTNDFITLFLALIFLKLALWDGQEFKIAKNPAIPIFFIFVLSTFVSGIYPLLTGNGSMIIQYFKTMINSFFIMSICYLLIINKIENETWNNFIKAWLLLSILINLFGVYQIIARAMDLPFAWIDLTSASFFSRNMNDVDEFTQLSLRFEGFFRATSFFSEPSALGAFNGLTLTFAIIPKFKGLKSFFKSKILNNTILYLSVIGLLLAFSLTGVSIVLLVLFTVFLTERLKVFGGMLKVLPFAIILVIAADSIVENYSGISVLKMFGQRFGSIFSLLSGSGSYGGGIDGESVTMRGANFDAMLEIWRSSPIIGIGLGLTYLSPLSNGWAFSDTSFGAVLAELGIFGIIPYISLYIAFYVIGFRIIKSKSIYSKLDHDSQRLISLTIYMMAYLVVTNFVSANNLINISSVLFIGLIFSILNNYYIDYAKEFYIIKFVNKPLKLLFYKQI
jgi:hypothetical protein